MPVKAAQMWEEKDLLHLVTLCCPTQLYKKLINCKAESLEQISLSAAWRWLSAAGRQRTKSLHGLKPAAAASNSSCQAGFTRAASPDLSKSLPGSHPFGTHTLCKLLCRSGFPGLETDLLLLGPRAVHADTRPRPSAQRHP
uniref:Uncharacterized protein n=1 Tax=Myotis myotis TaxID=51298 RepID=A0A7J7Y024_MYOMY|nr:hypothetical protein mMyoMyo1_011364 [Myotis myotis]